MNKQESRQQVEAKMPIQMMEDEYFRGRSQHISLSESLTNYNEQIQILEGNSNDNG